MNLTDHITRKGGGEWGGLNLSDHTSIWKREKSILRGVLFADLFKLLIPGGPAVVRLLPEPSDHVYVLIRVDHDVVGLWG